MENLQNFIDDPKKYGASQIAYGMALFIGGMTMLDRVRTYGLVDFWTSALFVVSAAVAAWGITFAIAYIFIHMLPGIAAVLSPVPPAKPTKKTVQQNQNVTIEALPTENKTESDYWIKNLKNHLLDNGMFRVRNTQRLLNPSLNTDWLYFLAETRWEGDLPHVSANYLHTYAGISRYTDNGGKTPSDLVIEFLESFNLIRREGQIYKWTAVGEEVFPTSPTEL